MTRTSIAAFFVATSVLAGCGGAPGDEPGATSEATSAAASAPVSLIAAEASWTLGSMQATPTRLIARIHVANLAYQKHVWIHYRAKSSQQVAQDWTDLDATLLDGLKEDDVES